jgi:hypothetical protein
VNTWPVLTRAGISDLAYVRAMARTSDSGNRGSKARYAFSANCHHRSPVRAVRLLSIATGLTRSTTRSNGQCIGASRLELIVEVDHPPRSGGQRAEWSSDPHHSDTWADTSRFLVIIFDPTLASSTSKMKPDSIELRSHERTYPVLGQSMLGFPPRDLPASSSDEKYAACAPSHTRSASSVHRDHGYPKLQQTARSPMSTAMGDSV